MSTPTQTTQTTQDLAGSTRTAPLASAKASMREAFQAKLRAAADRRAVPQPAEPASDARLQLKPSERILAATPVGGVEALLGADAPGIALQRNPGVGAIVMRRTPFLSEWAAISDMLALDDLAQRVERGEASDEDYAALRRFAVSSARPRDGLGYTLGTTLGELGPTMASFGVTRLAAKGAVAGIGMGVRASSRVVADKLFTTALSATARAAGREAATIAVQSAISPQTYVIATRDMMRSNVGIDDADEIARVQIGLDATAGPFLQALGHGYVDSLIENTTEIAGGKAISKGLEGGAKLLGKVPLPAAVRTAQAGVLAHLAQLHPELPVAQLLARLNSIAGYQGALAEMGEEVLGDLLRASVGFQSFGSVLPGADEALAQFIAFSLPGATVSAAQLAESALRRGASKPTPAKSTAPAKPTLSRIADTDADAAVADYLQDIDEDIAAFTPEPGSHGAQAQQQVLAAVRGAKAEAHIDSSVQGAADHRLARQLGLELVIADTNGAAGQAGVPAAYVPAPAGSAVRGFVVVDSSVPAAARRRTLLYHEAVHGAALAAQVPDGGTRGDVYGAVIAALERHVPELVARARESYARRFGREIDADLLTEESYAHAVEALSPAIEALADARVGPGLEALATAAPSFFRELVRSVRALLAKVLGPRVLAEHGRLVRDLRQRLEQADPRRELTHNLDARSVVRAAQAVREALHLLALTEGEVAATASRRAVQEQSERARALETAAAEESSLMSSERPTDAAAAAKWDAAAARRAREQRRQKYEAAVTRRQQRQAEGIPKIAEEMAAASTDEETAAAFRALAAQAGEARAEAIAEHRTRRERLTAQRAARASKGPDRTFEIGDVVRLPAGSKRLVGRVIDTSSGVEDGRTFRRIMVRVGKRGGVGPDAQYTQAFDAKDLQLVSHKDDASVTRTELQKRLARRKTKENRARFARAVEQPEYALSTEQRKDAFSRWFAGSKVVDSEGRPRVLYHGTIYEFTKFEGGRDRGNNFFGPGVYLTTGEDDAAQNYADPNGADRRSALEKKADKLEKVLSQELEHEMGVNELRGVPREEGEDDYDFAARAAHLLAQAEIYPAESSGGHILPLYVRLERPLIIGRNVTHIGGEETRFWAKKNSDGSLGRHPDTTLPQLVELLQLLETGGYQQSHEDVLAAAEFGENVDRAIGDNEKDVVSVGFTDFESKLRKELLWYESNVVKLLGRLGFDGIIDRRAGQRFGSMPGIRRTDAHVVAFRPTQIKSAVGNFGSFDEKSADIRFAASESPERIEIAQRLYARREYEANHARIKMPDGTLVQSMMQPARCDMWGPGVPNGVVSTLRFESEQHFLETAALLAKRIKRAVPRGPDGRPAFFYEDFARSALTLAGGDKRISDLYLRYLALLSPRASVAYNLTKSFGSGIAPHLGGFAPGFRAGGFAQVGSMARVLRDWENDKPLSIDEPGVSAKVLNFYRNGATELLRISGPVETLQKDKVLADPEMRNRMVTGDMWAMMGVSYLAREHNRKPNVWPGFMVAEQTGFAWADYDSRTRVPASSAVGQSTLAHLAHYGENSKRVADAGATYSWADLTEQEVEALEYDGDELSVFTRTLDEALSAKGVGPTYDIAQALFGAAADAINADGGIDGAPVTAYNVQELDWALTKMRNPLATQRNFQGYNGPIEALIDYIGAGMPAEKKVPAIHGLLRAAAEAYEVGAQAIVPFELATDFRGEWLQALTSASERGITPVEAVHVIGAALETALERVRREARLDWSVDAIDISTGYYTLFERDEQGNKVSGGRHAIDSQPSIVVHARGKDVEALDQTIRDALSQEASNAIMPLTVEAGIYFERLQRGEPQVPIASIDEKAVNVLELVGVGAMSANEQRALMSELSKTLLHNGEPLITGGTFFGDRLLIHDFYFGDREATNGYSAAWLSYLQEPATAQTLQGIAQRHGLTVAAPRIAIMQGGLNRNLERKKNQHGTITNTDPTSSASAANTGERKTHPGAVRGTAKVGAASRALRLRSHLLVAIQAAQHPVETSVGGYSVNQRAALARRIADIVREAKPSAKLTAKQKSKLTAVGSEAAIMQGETPMVPSIGKDYATQLFNAVQGLVTNPLKLVSDAPQTQEVLRNIAGEKIPPFLAARLRLGAKQLSTKVVAWNAQASKQRKGIEVLRRRERATASAYARTLASKTEDGKARAAQHANAQDVLRKQIASKTTETNALLVRIDNARIAIHAVDKLLNRKTAEPRPLTKLALLGPKSAAKTMRALTHREQFLSAQEAAPEGGIRMTDEGMLDRIQRLLQDQFLRVLRTETAVDAATGRKTVITDSTYKALERMPGIVRHELDEMDRRFLTPLATVLAKNDIPLADLDQYVYAIHAPERNHLFEQRDPETFDQHTNPASGMTTKGAVALAQELQRKHGKPLLEAAAIVRAMNAASLQRMLDKQLISRDLFDVLHKQFDHYVPLRTDVDSELSVLVGAGINASGSPLRRAAGRRSLADSPVGFSLAQYEEVIVRGEKNRVLLKLLNWARLNPAPNLWVVDVSPLSSVPGINLHDPRFALSDKTVGVRENGELLTITFVDPLMARAFKHTGMEASGALIRGLAKINRFLSSVYTQFSPEFVVTNMIRDVQSMLVNLGSDDARIMRGRILRNIPEAVAGAYRYSRGDRTSPWAQHAHDLGEAGGRIGWWYSYDIEARGVDLQKRIARINPKDGIERARAAMDGMLQYVSEVNGAVEGGVRLAVYEAAVAAGVPKFEAASVARNVTVNFNRRGELGPVINALVLFANANIQGNFNLVSRALRSNKVRAGLIAIAAAGFTQDIVNRLVAGNDDDGLNWWDKYSDADKARSWIVMMPDGSGRALRFPLPYGINAVHSFGRLTAATIFGSTTPADAAAQQFSSILNAFSPLNTSSAALAVTPTVTSPIISIAQNRDGLGHKIMPDSFPGQHLADSERYFHTVHPVFVEIAGSLNSLTGGDEVEGGMIDVSPETFEHWYEFATGGVGKFLSHITDTASALVTDDEVEPRNVPFLRTVYSAPTSQERSSLFYKQLEDVEIASAKMRHAIGNRDAARIRELRVTYGPQLSLVEAAKQARANVQDVRESMESATTHEARARLEAELDHIQVQFSRQFVSTVKRK